MKYLILLVLLFFAYFAFAADLPPAQKVTVEAYQKARAEGAANRQEAMKLCRKIATEHPVHPATVKEQQAAAYEGCMRAKGYTK